MHSQIPGAVQTRGGAQLEQIATESIVHHELYENNTDKLICVLLLCTLIMKHVILR